MQECECDDTILMELCAYLWPFAVFTFVYFLIYAVKAAVTGEGNEIERGVGAAVSLLVIVGACVLPNL